MLEKSWILAVTQPRREKWAAENVKRQGLECYLPMLAPECSGKHARFVPLFPRYLFVEIVQAWHFLLSTYGVQTVVVNGVSPVRVPRRIITDLKARENEQGYIHLPERQRFNRNDPVRVSAGPFAGRIGLYAGQTAANRVRVLLECLGGRVPMLLAENQVEAA